VRATLLAAVGFEVLKLVGTFYIARVTRSPAGVVIGPVVGVLVWINLVSRYLLYCVAWAAVSQPGTALPERVEELLTAPVQGPPLPSGGGAFAGQPGRTARPGASPAAVAAGLLSAGAALGAGSLAVLQRWHHRATARRRSAR
jgi:membrane protein